MRSPPPAPSSPSAPPSSLDGSAGRHLVVPAPTSVGIRATPLRVDRVALYDRALAGLRRHLLPLLQADLHDVAARTGLPAETLRKRKRDLERGVRSLPGADALTAVAAAYGWSLDALLDGESESPVRQPVESVLPPAVAPLLSAHIRHVVTSAVRRNKPWAVEAVLGVDPDDLLARFEQASIEQVSNLLRTVEGQLEEECEQEWRLAVAALAGASAIAFVAEDSVLAPWAELLVARIQRAVSQGTWEFTAGRFVFPPVAVRATDPWDLARGVMPAVNRMTALVGSRVGHAVDVAFEVSAAEVQAAREHLTRTRAVGRGAGFRACSVDEVLRAYEQFRQQWRCWPHAPRSLVAVCDARATGDTGPSYDAWAMHDLFVDFCRQVGLVWHREPWHFTLAQPGGGRFDDYLAPHTRHDRLIVVEWGVEYWKLPVGDPANRT